VLISCKQCSTTYSIDDDRVVSEGISLQCAHCGHVFKLSPTGEEEEADSQMTTPPLLLSQELSAFSDEEAAYPSSGATQLFGFSPSEGVFSTSASQPSPWAGEAEHAKEAALDEQPLRENSPSVYKQEAHEVAYFDFGANYSREDPLSSIFMREISSASSQELAPEASSVPEAPLQVVAPILLPFVDQAQPAPADAPRFMEQADEPTQRFVAQLDEPTQQSFIEELPPCVIEESRQVEDEETDQHEPFRPSAEIVAPTQKTQWWKISLVVLVAVLLSIFAVAWWVLGYSPQQVWFEIQRYILSLRAS